MSFVQRLRMANMFPVNSNIGDANIDTSGPDPMRDVIDAGEQLALFNRNLLHPNGLQRVAQGNPLPGSGNFGNLFNRPTNFRTENAQGIDLGKPEPQIMPGAENNIINKDANGELDIDKNLARATKISAIENANKRTSIAEENASKSKKKVIAITDPNDPTKQINAFYDENTEQVTPMKMTGVDTVQPGASAKTNQAEIDKNKKEAESEDLLKNHANDALNVLNEVSKATGKFDDEGNSVEELSPATQNITGFSGNIPAFLNDLNPDNATARASIKRLTDMLTLDRMQSLRAQSKTGTTGFGSNMNQKEFGTLVSSASKLATMNQSEPGYAKELGRVRVLLSKVANGTAPGMKGNESKSETNAPKAPEGYVYVRRPDDRGWFAKKVGSK